MFKKRGEPLLAVSRGAPAGPALDLYAAQTPLARLAKLLWRQTLSLGLLAAAERVTLELDPEDPFVQWLARLTQPGSGGSAEMKIPQFALLAGNARVPGRRFLLLLFGSDGRPQAVVKAGTDPAAVALVAKEAAFLETAPAAAPGVPKLRQRFSHGTLSALAMDYVAGHSPPTSESAGALKLLESWLAFGRNTTLRDLPAWQRLAQAAQSDPVFRRIAATLEPLVVQAPLFHGDFAPWNVKVSGVHGGCTVLDWERGEPAGPPGWDWFHYGLQPAVLVRRQDAPTLARTAGDLLASTPFRHYAEASGINGCEGQMLLAYLLHCRDVLRPAEGSPQIIELLDLLGRPPSTSAYEMGP